MKKIIYCLFVSVMLSACVSNSSKKSSSDQGSVEQSVVEHVQIEWNEPKYSVGDIIMVGGELGVVFAVTSDGEHGKVMSVSQTECSWNKAKTWCARYGSSWRLPSVYELRIISKKCDVLNSALTANGYEILVLDEPIWSSDEYGPDGARYVDMYNGLTLISLKDSNLYVRAVSAF